MAGLGIVVISLFVRKLDNIVTKILFSIGIYVLITTIWFILKIFVLYLIS